MLSRWGAGPALPSAVADVRGACTTPGQHSKGGHGYGGRNEPASQCEHESFGLTTLLSRVGSGAGSMPSSLLPLVSCSTWEARPYTLFWQHSRGGPGGEDMDETASKA